MPVGGARASACKSSRGKNLKLVQVIVFQRRPLGPMREEEHYAHNIGYDVTCHVHLFSEGQTTKDRCSPSLFHPGR